MDLQMSNLNQIKSQDNQFDKVIYTYMEPYKIIQNKGQPYNSKNK